MKYQLSLYQTASFVFAFVPENDVVIAYSFHSYLLKITSQSDFSFSVLYLCVRHMYMYGTVR